MTQMRNAHTLRMALSPTSDHAEDWFNRAACAEIGGDAWYPEQGERSESRLARAICENSCPVRQQCFEYALRARPEFGIWAGYTSRQIRNMRIAEQQRRRQEGVA